MIEDLNTDFEYSIRKTSEDKLTYKNIIADAINWCRKSMGTMYFREAVKGLEKIIKFDVTGYSLLSEIENIQIQLNIEKKEMIKYKKHKLGRHFYGNAEQAKFKLELSEWYWSAYFERIIQLLASNGLLFDTEKTIPIKEIGRVKDE